MSNQKDSPSFTNNNTISDLESFSDYLSIHQRTQEIKSEKDEKKTDEISKLNLVESEENLEEANSNKIDYRRTDVLFKSSLRFVRNQFRDLFKYKNKTIVKNRYVNCKTKRIFEQVKETLSNLLHEECISDSLVYYCIGIFKLKDYNKIPCPVPIKQEVKMFLR